MKGGQLFVALLKLKCRTKGNLTNKKYCTIYKLLNKDLRASDKLNIKFSMV